MNLRQLEILHTVVRCHTTVQAAKELGLSQPAISNALKAMETQMGFPLFERVNNRLFPTPEARLICEEAAPIFATHHTLERKLQDLRENKGGQLRIIATPPLGYGVIPVALKRFLLRRPRVRVFFDVRRMEHVIESVESNRAELGFGLGVPDHPNLRRESFFEGRMVCVFPPGHALAEKAVITPADLAAFPFIALERDSRLGSAVRRSFEKAAMPFNFAVEVRYCNTACVLTEAGVGVAVVDPLTPSYGPRFALETRPFKPATPVVAYAAWSSARTLSRLATSFLREMRAACAELNPQHGGDVPS